MISTSNVRVKVREIIFQYGSLIPLGAAAPE